MSTRRRQMQDIPHDIIMKPSDEVYERAYERVFGNRKPTYLMTEEELDARVTHIRMEEDVDKPRDTGRHHYDGNATCQRELYKSRNRIFMTK
jgi:hypothetical protein